MKNLKAISHIITLVILFDIAARNYATAEQKCPGKRDNRLLHQDFGVALTADDIISSMMAPWMVQDYFRPWRRLESFSKDLGSTIKTDKDKFEINLDVQHFSPEEITVKTAEGYVIIEAKHEEKEDNHGFVSRQFVRRYSLPEGAVTENVVSELSSDGILTVTAPRKEIDDTGERVVPITRTGSVRKESDEKTKDEDIQGSCESEKCNNV